MTLAVKVLLNPNTTNQTTNILLDFEISALLPANKAWTDNT